MNYLREEEVLLRFLQGKQGIGRSCQSLGRTLWVWDNPITAKWVARWRDLAGKVLEFSPSVQKAEWSRSVRIQNRLLNLTGS